MRRGIGSRQIGGAVLHIAAVAILLLAAADGASAQASRGRSDSLFEPWNASRGTGRAPRRARIPDAPPPPADPVFAPARGSYRLPQAFGHRLPAHLQRQTVTYPTPEAPGTIVIDTANTFLYLVLGDGQALRYGIGVGREGFTWSGRERISRKSEWPDWRPPEEMIARQPDLPRFMAGGLGNPLGARALYLGNTLYRIHGTNEPDSIGTHSSSGCIRLLNEDAIDLYQRVPIGTPVVVLRGNAEAAAPQPR